jgi:D-2-hydroxyacid dehydrogenase (NADP+)
MVILHDFNLDLDHFTLPDNLIKKIELLGFKILDINKSSLEERKKCTVFFGNRIKSEDLIFLPNLKYIHLGCVGYNNLDVEKLKDKKIILSNSSNIVEDAMAEMVLTAIMWFNKRIYEIDENHKISRTFYNKFYNNLRLLSSTKVLVYGYGLVGKKTVDLLKNLTSHITIVKRKINESNNHNIIDPESALKVIDEYDYIINCLPLNSSSKKYFNKNYFKLMHSQSIYINIGRSGTTEINDLINFINLKKIRGTYLDVYEETDLKKLNPINNNRILVTPHISGWHNKYWLNQSKLCLNNLVKYREGNYKQIENLITLSNK